MSRLRAQFASATRERRHALGWSQERLAEAAGLHRTYVSGVERGERNISIDNIERLCRALGSTPAEMMGKPDPPST